MMKERSLYQKWYRDLFILENVLTFTRKCAAALATYEVARAALVIKNILIARRKHMKPKQIRKFLMKEINKVSTNPKIYCFNPESSFTRKRKISMKNVLTEIIGMGSGSLTNELIDFCKASPDMPTKSAFVQQRNKIKPEAFKAVFDGFTKKISEKTSEDIPILAVDGTDLQIATNPADTETYYPGTDNQKGYNLLHLNALYDINTHLYVDAVIQKNRKNMNEHKALQEMVDHSSFFKAIIIADRGYESYNNMAHIQEKGWYFLIRIKDGKGSIKDNLNLPDQESFDIEINLNLTRKQSNETKILFKDKNHYRFLPTNVNFDYLPDKSNYKDPAIFYNLHFRIVRFPISENTYETVLTNLDIQSYPREKLKQLYSLRWGIETSFRDLKYTIGMLNFHSKKVMCIQQEIYAQLIMYNFSEMITSHVVIERKKRKYIYKANFSVATHMCRLFYRYKTTSPNLETIIAKNLVPIRPDRHRERHPSPRLFHGFLYRVS